MTCAGHIYVAQVIGSLLRTVKTSDNVFEIRVKSVDKKYQCNYTRLSKPTHDLSDIDMTCAGHSVVTFNFGDLLRLCEFENGFICLLWPSKPTHDLSDIYMTCAGQSVVTLISGTC
jgi:hypothetical protein